MASKVILIKLTSTPVTLITNNPTTLTQNSFMSLANKNIVVSSHLGVYLLTTIGSSEVSIRTFVPAFVSTEPYHNALIVNIFFRKISTISATPSVTFSSLMMTVAMYFGINTGSAEREVEVAVPSICKAFICVSNLQGVGFANVFGKPIQVPNFVHRPTDLTYFNFRSIVSTTVVDSRALDKVFFLEILLPLLQTLSSSFVSASTTDTNHPLGTTPSKPEEYIGFILGGYSDTIIS